MSPNDPEPYQLDLFDQPPCKNCKRLLEEHEHLKCLFESTEYEPGEHTFASWRKQAERHGTATIEFTPYERAYRAMETEEAKKAFVKALNGISS